MLFWKKKKIFLNVIFECLNDFKKVCFDLFFVFVYFRRVFDKYLG